MVKVTNATFFLAPFSVNMRTDASAKRHNQTQAPNASTNGGDASRVGIEKGGKYESLLNNSCIFSRRETRRSH